MAIAQGKRALHLLPDGHESTRANDIVETALELKKGENAQLSQDQPSISKIKKTS